MKKIILISILLYSISCSFRHIPIMPGGKNNKIEYMKISVLPDTIRFSNNFRMLWDDLLKEANGYLSSLNSSYKCNGIHINNLFKFFVWCEVSKSFTRSII